MTKPRSGILAVDARGTPQAERAEPAGSPAEAGDRRPKPYPVEETESSNPDRPGSAPGVRQTQGQDRDGRWGGAAIGEATLLIRQLELPLQLIGGLLPTMAVWAVQDRVLFTAFYNETLVALAAASVLSWYVLSKLREHAKARHLSYILPVNFLVFSGALGVLALLRLPYSASVFATGAGCTILASFLLAVRSRGLLRPHLIVPGGRAAEINLTGNYLPAPSAADLTGLVRSGRRNWAIVADLHYSHSPGWERLFAEAALAGIPVYHFRQIAEMQTGQVKITHLSENDLGSLIPNVSYMSMKRLIDIVAALVLLPFCLVGFALLAIVIRLDSPGKAFFIQDRVGFRGQTFRLFKFRTMRERDVKAESQARREDAMTRSDDDRITRVGRFLRKTRIDELPQIFNILKGDMSFVGPRPEAKALAEWYEEELPFYSYRHIVRPGITGWAQVNQGHVTDVSDILSKLRYDFYYIRNISLWLDVLVALKTLRVIVTGMGAK
ncbi:exopolysaccharide biosynthesis polyprenyl glycosylphosphotransferase [Erythrobacter sp. HL-111]|uniref:exopolysaccharide biosynthesis polyprenyl glycosylphosphotransferase n=1 Tax=Erythrobacter sp. HL-111 TaxID=1798193 RepID=UPI0006D9E417|nr:exopolysaccharide biosynthesis polyprenyl glycosylphosphotransferase [Erythrobacter sp. HL-111]KPP95371.1 MAG: Sugar transferases involved in lipopolysaccharide synthesis [Erythrobacteraceae bacterium HL-111]SDS67162.1 exopolysaccharide biosynthesis polyprenyl glycosylphosphotransferase [Erythrobacter sp. HL-111]